jgi:hypothetical protein
VSKEIMKDQIDVSVRRSPKYSVFMGIGAVLGIAIAGILAIFVDPPICRWAIRWPRGWA